MAGSEVRLLQEFMSDVSYRLTFAARKKIQGVLPQKRDLVDWSESKMLQFLKYVNFFTVDGKFKVTNEMIADADARGEDEPFWDEFNWRMGVRVGIDGGTSKQFMYRLLSFARIPLGWMKSNPHAVTPEMLEIMENNPRMKWASSAFKLIETDVGAKIVVMDQDETTDPGRKNVQPGSTNVESPLVKYEQAKLSMLTMLQALGKSIPNSELKNMAVKDRIAAFDKLLNTAQKILVGQKASTQIFQQINVNKAGRAELEKSFLEYAENQTTA